ncbi:MAG: ribbon-helix-helix protein, CopG family [Acidimicrobiales bacterium]
MHKTTLYLTDELRRALDGAARRTGRTQADIVRDALRTHLQSLGAPSPRSIGAGEDAGLAARDSEEWLHRRWAKR